MSALRTQGVQTDALVVRLLAAFSARGYVSQTSVPCLSALDSAYQNYVVVRRFENFCALGWLSSSNLITTAFSQQTALALPGPLICYREHVLFVVDRPWYPDPSCHRLARTAADFLPRLLSCGVDPRSGMLYQVYSPD